MIRATRWVPAAIVAAALSGTLLDATPAQAPAPQADTTSTTSLKLTVVISRYQGEKKIGNLPFVLMVVPSSRVVDGEKTFLQMGSDVPVPVGVITSDASGKPQGGSYQYRTLGTSITGAAHRVDDVHFDVYLEVTDSQLMGDPGNQGVAGQPRFQNFRSTNRVILRDGQTIQYTAATDKTSGEVAKIDVTLNVVK